MGISKKSATSVAVNRDYHFRLELRCGRDRRLSPSFALLVRENSVVPTPLSDLADTAACPPSVAAVVKKIERVRECGI